MKNSSDTIGNRTRDLLACSAVPQPTAPPAACPPLKYKRPIIIKELQKQPTGHCTQTTESVNLKVRNIFHGRNNITCSTNCKYRKAATLHALETWFASGI